MDDYGCSSSQYKVLAAPNGDLPSKMGASIDMTTDYGGFGMVVLHLTWDHEHS